MPTPLASLEVLILDCQTTGANPQRGDLLEVAWAPTAASDPLAAKQIRSHLVALPEGRGVPHRIARLTGIDDEHLTGATPPATLWPRLAAELRAARPAVIHAAHFEEPFLHDLHRRFGDGELRLEAICTLRIAKRLLPELPRRGLHALAGYWGHPVGRLKRAADHVAATATVWRELLRLLRARQGIDDLDALRAWLATERPTPRADRRYPLPRAERLALPEGPGVYHYWRKNGDLLYVGKARNLKRRVNSYFQKRSGVAERQLEMLTQARRVTCVETATALEAALLETDEIKRRAPPYNHALRAADRGLWFCTAHLRRLDAAPTCHGPVPSRQTLAALVSLCCILRQERREAVSLDRRAATLAVPPRFAPEADCFAAGLASFLAERDLTPGPSLAARLLAIGTTAWIERRAARAAQKTAPVDDAAEIDEEGAATEPLSGWSPDRVQRSLETLVLRAGGLLRRARWLVRLSEATVRFQEASRPHRELIISGGAVIARRDRSTADAIAVPPGWRRRQADRRAALNLDTYDRLRVMTTELRGLAAGDDAVAIRLAPTVTIRGPQLRRLLEWV